MQTDGKGGRVTASLASSLRVAMAYFRLQLSVLLLTAAATLAFLGLRPVLAQTPSPKLRCQEPEFRQFDFWLGKWTVRNPAGNEVGRSEVSRQSGDCAIREQWTAASGNGGMSLNYYDPAEHSWHQDWVGSDGTILHLRGGLKDGAMVLTSKAAKDSSALNRIRWTPLPNKQVRQEWAMSSDGGKTWQTAFDGLYSPE